MSTNPTSIRIIVFDKTNVGKTSMINLLTNSNRKTNNDAIGCTFETEQCPVQIGSRSFLFYDTAGLNEISGGWVSRNQAIKNLIKLLGNLSEGLNLLIYVRNCVALDELDEKNFEIMNKITRGKVPCLCVNTGAENEINLMDWWNKNSKILIANENVEFKDGVSVCCGTAPNPRINEVYKSLHNESKEIILDAWEICCR